MDVSGHPQLVEKVGVFSLQAFLMAFFSSFLFEILLENKLPHT